MGVVIVVLISVVSGVVIGLFALGRGKRRQRSRQQQSNNTPLPTPGHPPPMHTQNDPSIHTTGTYAATQHTGESQGFANALYGLSDAEIDGKFDLPPLYTTVEN